MTMPSKILIGVKHHEEVVIDPIDPERERYGATPYIRADIAEELARALEAVMIGEESADTMYAQMKAQDALSRFREVMSKT